MLCSRDLLDKLADDDPWYRERKEKLREIVKKYDIKLKEESL